MTGYREVIDPAVKIAGSIANTGGAHGGVSCDTAMPQEDVLRCQINGGDELEPSTVDNEFDDITEKPLQLLAELLDGIDEIALLDYPEYANVGDSLIWLGQIALFKRLKKRVVYVAAAWHSDDAALRKVVDNGAAIIIMGGGNFGTLWPHHQTYREHIMRAFADATIIQMPQSICFEDEAALARTREIIANCSNFHLLARDFPSLEFATANFAAPISLCPDSAFFLGPIAVDPTDVDVVYLRRSDKESNVGTDVDSYRRRGLRVEVTDWLEQDLPERIMQRCVRALIKSGAIRNTSPLLRHAYNLLAQLRARRGIRILARGHCVVTDRLHAHILSVLLGRSNFLLDNSNGKVFAFHTAWTKHSRFTCRATTVDEAFDLAVRLRQTAVRPRI